MAQIAQVTAAIANAAQREKWNGETGSRWLERHAFIDQQITPFGRRAMDRAGIRPGQRVLDVGCGCGETTVELARRVGPAGSVVGVDISALLIEAAGDLAQENGAANARFEQADAQIHGFSAASFDLIFSRFGIMFFDDPDAAFRNVRAALAPAGRLAFVCWPAARENQFVTLPLAAAGRHVVLPPPGDPDAPGAFAFGNPDRVSRILARSSFTDVEIGQITEKVGGKSLDEMTRLLLRLGPLDEILADLDAATIEAIAAELRAALAPLETDGRVFLDAKAWLVTARA